MPRCIIADCGRPIPEERLTGYTIPAKTCSRACAEALKKLRNQEKYERWKIRQQERKG